MTAASIAVDKTFTVPVFMTGARCCAPTLSEARPSTLDIEGIEWKTDSGSVKFQMNDRKYRSAALKFEGAVNEIESACKTRRRSDLEK
jgi:hypothetical protein